jgi:Polyketide cyclase / dehydrase and lipid transport.
MAVTSIEATFKCSVEEVWKVVTSLDNYSWRSDLSKIEVLSETQFIEYTKDGYSTTFTITAEVPFERWEFDIENDNIKGHWVGLFIQNGEVTTINFMEEVEAKKVFMKPFVKSYLRKQQSLYVADLKKALL